MKPMYIMLKDSPVIYFNFDDMTVEIINNNLVPYGLRGRIKPVIGNTPVEIAKNMAYNVEEVKEWMSNRVLSLSRDNAKQIYNMFNISQTNDRTTRANTCLKCQGVSVTDSYWVKLETDNKKWADVNIRKNHFKEIVDVALNGENPSITTNPICPELTTKGLFKKAWIRDIETKELYLLKSDKHSENINTRCEVLASKILDCFTNVPHVQYNGRMRSTNTGKIYVDKCKNFVGEEYSFVEAREIIGYCELCNINFRDWAVKKFGSKFANIAIVDYILVNTDRHDVNYGFMMDNDTGLLVDVAPLFDFNLALVADLLNVNAVCTMSQMFNTNETIENIAMQMLPYSNIKIDYDKLKQAKRYFKNEYQKVYKNILERVDYLFK